MSGLTRLSFPFLGLAAGVAPPLGSGPCEWAQAQRQKVGTSPAPKPGGRTSTPVGWPWPPSSRSYQVALDPGPSRGILQQVRISNPSPKVKSKYTKYTHAHTHTRSTWHRSLQGVGSNPPPPSPTASSRGCAAAPGNSGEFPPIASQRRSSTHTGAWLRTAVKPKLSSDRASACVRDPQSRPAGACLGRLGTGV